MLEAEARRGGMGSVWKARDAQSGAPVAFKLLHDTSPEQSRRFVRERQLLADLTHPNIVSYVAHGVIEQDTPYLVMEWLEGESLAERLARAPLTLAESMSMLRSALAGPTHSGRARPAVRPVQPAPGWSGRRAWSGFWRLAPAPAGPGTAPPPAARPCPPVLRGRGLCCPKRVGRRRWADR